MLGGNALNRPRGRIVSSNAITQTISNAITLGVSQTWIAAAGNLTLAGNINNNGNLLTVSGNFNSLISGSSAGRVD